MPSTPNLHLPYPIPDDPVDVPYDIGALAAAVDGIGVVPVGAVTMWMLTAPPSGWLVCNGQQVDAATYPALAALLGATSGMVTIPDLRDRLPIGASASRPLRSTGGAASVTLTGAQSGMPSHAHSNTLAVAGAGGHDHDVQSAGELVAAGANFLSGKIGKNSGTSLGRTQSVSNHTHPITGGVSAAAAQNASQAHDNMPPYIAMQFIMKAG